MDTTFVKLLLAAAILFVLWKSMAKGRLLRMPAAAPRGYYDGEFFEDEDSAEDIEDSEYEEDEDLEEDEDYEESEGEEDYEEDEASDAGGEGYDNFEGEEQYQNASRQQPLLSASSSLLPKQNTKMAGFAEFAPKGLQGQNFLEASKYIGVNTQGSSLRNANYDLRAAPTIPRRQVGPWSQSTIDPDPFRKPLE